MTTSPRYTTADEIFPLWQEYGFLPAEGAIYRAPHYPGGVPQACALGIVCVAEGLLDRSALVTDVLTPAVSITAALGKRGYTVSFIAGLVRGFDMAELCHGPCCGPEYEDPSYSDGAEVGQELRRRIGWAVVSPTA